MEKYRQFSHAATGVNPFLPTSIKSDPTLRVVRFLLLLPLNLVRVLVLICLLPCLFAFKSVSILRRILLPITARIMLSILGVAIRIQSPEYRKLKLTEGILQSSKETLVVQTQSPIDPLILMAIACTSCFGFLQPDGSVVQGLSFCCQSKPPVSSRVSLTEFLQQSTNKVLFVDVARTNGSGLLAWPKGTATCLKQVPLSFCGINYSTGNPANAHFTVGSFSQWLIGFALYFHTADVLVARSIPIEDPRQALVRVASAARKEEVVDTDLTAETAAKFHDYWMTSQSQKKKVI